MVSVCMEHAARWTGADKIKPDKIRRLTSAPEISRDFHRDIGCLQQLWTVKLGNGKLDKITGKMAAAVLITRGPRWPHKRALRQSAEV